MPAHPSTNSTGQAKPSVRRFEQLVAWQRARALTREVYTSTRSGSFAKDFALSNQIQRAAVSVMSNIAEGSERMHPKEFHQFLATSKASCAEVRSHLYVALDVGHIDQPKFDHLMALADEAARVIGGLRASVAKRISS